MNELKPCPFCGDSAVPYHDAEAGGWGVICTNQKCECNLDRYATRESAEAAWNRRAQLAAAPVAAQEPTADLVAGYQAWMHATCVFPHNNDNRHPFDAFKAGAKWATQPAQGEQDSAKMICAKCGVDRFKNCCPNHCEGCPMVATAQGERQP